MGQEGESLERAQAQTNQSLAGERVAADKILETRVDKVEAKLDQDLAKSRSVADEVRTRSREMSDTQLSPLPAKERAHLAAERRLNDRALDHERAVTDSKLAAERSARRRAIAELLSVERERTDEDLREERECADEAVEVRDDALAAVSHELRNLIGTVSLSAGSIIRNSNPDPQHPTLEAKRIERTAERMLRLVTDLLDVASIGYGRLTILRCSNDANLLVREVREAFEPIAATKEISLGVFCDVGSKGAWYDSDRAHQVLANLVSNAIKFTPRGGRVEIRAERIEDDLCFAVQDTGPGIAEDQREAIFDRFRQLQNGATNNDGHGLGLYICRAIVEAHGGWIRVESAPSGGSSFVFTLPATEEHAARSTRGSRS